MDGDWQALWEESNAKEIEVACKLESMEIFILFTKRGDKEKNYVIDRLWQNFDNILYSFIFTLNNIAFYKMHELATEIF